MANGDVVLRRYWMTVTEVVSLSSESEATIVRGREEKFPGKRAVEFTIPLHWLFS